MKNRHDLVLTKRFCASLSIISIMLAEICFYKSGAMPLYTILITIGLILTVLCAIMKDNLKQKYNYKFFFVWVILVYAMYFIYGFFIRKSDTFSWDSLLLRLIENISLYICLDYLIMSDNTKMLKNVLLSISIFSIAYLVINEGAAIIANSGRIGGELSDNVNIVGYNMGLLATFHLWFYLKTKDKKNLLLFIILMILGLLTGSKKVLLILATNAVMYLCFNKDKIIKWLLVGAASVLAVVGLFSIPAFYNIMGRRVEKMVSTMFVEDYAKSEYSYSTDMREIMIKEGLELIPEHPIFGGGWGFFASRTSTGYRYSHNNFIEIMCSFGLFGLLMYYSITIRNTIILVKCKKSIVGKDLQAMVILAFMLILIICLMDWTAVMFSAQCVWYVPIIISTIIVQKVLISQKEERIRLDENKKAIV
ncbi:O-antigen ligase family protein [Candidatus Saccharibacteria bacterium]|nr:O-antigen ligase family protein [Candidatus Saccharibacteria bacterium]